MAIRRFCHDAAQINTILMTELFLEMTQWKVFMSAWVQVLDFMKSLVYSNCQNDRKFCVFLLLFFVCFFFYVPCIFYHLYVCLLLDQLCINYLLKRILWKYSI